MAFRDCHTKRNIKCAWTSWVNYSNFEDFKTPQSPKQICNADKHGLLWYLFLWHYYSCCALACCEPGHKLSQERITVLCCVVPTLPADVKLQEKSTFLQRNWKHKYAISRVHIWIIQFSKRDLSTNLCHIHENLITKGLPEKAVQLWRASEHASKNVLKSDDGKLFVKNWPLNETALTTNASPIDFHNKKAL
jgi:hypothetical protein